MVAQKPFKLYFKGILKQTYFTGSVAGLKYLIGYLVLNRFHDVMYVKHISFSQCRSSKRIIMNAGNKVVQYMSQIQESYTSLYNLITSAITWQ